jgi:hypothetical protein
VCNWYIAVIHQNTSSDSSEPRTSKNNLSVSPKMRTSGGNSQLDFKGLLQKVKEGHEEEDILYMESEKSMFKPFDFKSNNDN